MSAPRPVLAYLVNQYPSVSHTFIRREIRGLEALGHTIHRFALRPGAHVDPEDAEEAQATRYLLGGSKAALLLRAAGVLLTRPRAAGAALVKMWRMHRQSERGLLRHGAYLAEAAVLVRALETLGVDHLHVHFGTNAAAVGRLARALGGPPYSMTIHGPDEFDAAIGLSLGPKMEDAAFTVAITDFCASQLRRWVAYRHWGKIHIVGCTVGPTWFDAAADLDDDADSLVCVGRLSAQKGQLLLLDAFARARADGARGRLVLVGDGEMRPEAEARIASLGLAESVTITGWQDEVQVRAHLLAARALVLGSFAEGLPVVIMEALALGRPVVATRINGIPELVRDGQEGWLVTPGNVEQLAAAMAEALNAPASALRALGASGRERVRARHSTDSEIPKLDRLFRGEGVDTAAGQE